MSMNSLFVRFKIQEPRGKTDVYSLVSFIFFLVLDSRFRSQEQRHRYVSVLGSFVLALCVENIGVEPMTPCVQGRCSSQLS